jgi:hypothetical protein
MRGPSSAPLQANADSTNGKNHMAFMSLRSSIRAFARLERTSHADGQLLITTEVVT